MADKHRTDQGNPEPDDPDKTESVHREVIDRWLKGQPDSCPKGEEKPRPKGLWNR